MLKTKNRILKTGPKILVNAPQDQLFWVNDGPVVKNLRELINALKKITREQFDFHTKRDGNDFARWIRDVLRQGPLATKIRRIKTKEGLANAIENYLKK